MAKTPTPTQPPKALDTLVNISNMAMDFRFPEKTPKLSDMARVVSAASRLLRYSNLDERIEVENAALIQIAKARQLVS